MYSRDKWIYQCLFTQRSLSVERERIVAAVFLNFSWIWWINPHTLVVSFLCISQPAPKNFPFFSTPLSHLWIYILKFLILILNKVGSGGFGRQQLLTPSQGALPFSAFPCRSSSVRIRSLLWNSKGSIESIGLPGSREKEHFDAQSTEHLRPLFSHERAVLKYQVVNLGKKWTCEI